MVDLSHVITDGMVTYPGIPAPVIGAHLTFDESASHYAAGTEFSHRHHLDGGQHRHLPGHPGAPLPGRRGSVGAEPGPDGRPRRRGGQGAAPVGGRRSGDRRVGPASARWADSTGGSRGVDRDRAQRPLGNARLLRRPSLPDRRRGRVPGLGEAGAGRDRLAEHRLHPHRPASGAQLAAGRADPDRRAPDPARRSCRTPGSGSPRRRRRCGGWAPSRCGPSRGGRLACR